MAALKARDERRHWPRLDINVAVCVRKVALGPECVNERRLSARNVSTGGVLLEMADGVLPAVGDVLEVALDMTSEEASCRGPRFLKARGRATRTQRCEGSGRQLVAIEFFLPPMLSRGTSDIYGCV